MSRLKKMSLPSEQNFLESSKKLFLYYKGLGEKAIALLSDEQILGNPNDEISAAPSLAPQTATLPPF